MNKKYTVWAGGTEVNDYYLNLEQAKSLKKVYLNDGYDDVYIEEVNNE